MLRATIVLRLQISRFIKCKYFFQVYKSLHWCNKYKDLIKI